VFPPTADVGSDLLGIVLNLCTIRQDRTQPTTVRLTTRTYARPFRCRTGTDGNIYVLRRSSRRSFIDLAAVNSPDVEIKSPSGVCQYISRFSQSRRHFLLDENEHPDSRRGRRPDWTPIAPIRPGGLGRPSPVILLTKAFTFLHLENERLEVSEPSRTEIADAAATCQFHGSAEHSTHLPRCFDPTFDRYPNVSGDS